MRIVKKKADMTETIWPARKIVEMLELKQLDLELAIQRGIVWDKDVTRMSEFIMSLAICRPIPPMYVAKIEDKYYAMDGKQRTTTIAKYMKDEFALEGVSEIVEIIDSETGEIEEVDINGLYFSQLDECIQMAIKDATMTAVIIDNPTEDEMSDYFYYLNNGVPLTSTMVARAKAKSKKKIRRLAAHEIHKQTLSQKMIEAYENEKQAVKFYAILYEEEPRMSDAVITKLMKNVDITDEQEKEMFAVYDRIMAMHDIIEDKSVAKKVVTKLHTLSIMPIVKRSIEDGFTERQIADWFISFFSGPRASAISDDYKRCARSCTGSKESIRIRLREIEKSYDKFFEKDLAMAS